ncbi:uncharacterized protein LOC134280893 [Saccostrea cucullata]|uniref:uncharacterized protein LOC134280893 n=1 Tax=Saccostrea cuccullata TaxID=36930 RepID=UPI002ED08EA9
MYLKIFLIFVGVHLQTRRGYAKDSGLVFIGKSTSVVPTEVPTQQLTTTSNPTNNTGEEIGDDYFKTGQAERIALAIGLPISFILAVIVFLIIKKLKKDILFRQPITATYDMQSEDVEIVLKK